MSALALAERALGQAGGDALALVTRERSLLLRFAANRPTQATQVDDLTVELAVLRRGHVGRAETNATGDEALAACARRAAAAADAAAAAGDGIYPGFPDSLGAGSVAGATGLARRRRRRGRARRRVPRRVRGRARGARDLVGG